MSQNKNLLRIQNAIDQSLIFSMLIYPSSFSTLSKYLKTSIKEFNFDYFTQTFNTFGSLLRKMNPFLLSNITDEENDVNAMLQEDNIDLLKSKLLNHALDLNHQDRNGISLIEKCALFDSKICLKFLLDENVNVSKHIFIIDHTNFLIGLMEYGTLKGNKDVIKFCIEKGQKIQRETLILGLIGHQNELVEWMIEEGIKRNFFKESIETEILGIADNIDFNEILLKKGVNVFSKNKDKKRRNKEAQH